MDFRVLKINYDLHQVRAVAWCPDPSHPRLLSVGLGNGKCAVVNLTGEASPPHPVACHRTLW